MFDCFFIGFVVWGEGVSRRGRRFKSEIVRVVVVVVVVVFILGINFLLVNSLFVGMDLMSF